MRNKKYRPIKLWIILLLITLIVPLSLIFVEGWKKYVILMCGIVSILGLFMCLSYFFEVKEDRILIRHGLSSFNRQYRLNFKTRIIMIKDINSIDIRDNGKTIIFGLKGEIEIYFQIGGYFNKNEIINLFCDVKKQIS